MIPVNNNPDQNRTAGGTPRSANTNNPSGTPVRYAGGNPAGQQQPRQNPYADRNYAQGQQTQNRQPSPSPNQNQDPYGRQSQGRAAGRGTRIR